MSDKPNLAHLLDGVTRYNRIGQQMEQSPDGRWLHRLEVLAALSAAHHVNETPKSEHDRADVLTALAAERDKTAKLVEALTQITQEDQREDPWHFWKKEDGHFAKISRAALSEIEDRRTEGAKAEART